MLLTESMISNSGAPSLRLVKLLKDFKSKYSITFTFHSTPYRVVSEKDVGRMKKSLLSVYGNGRPCQPQPHRDFALRMSYVQMDLRQMQASPILTACPTWLHHSDHCTLVTMVPLPKDVQQIWTRSCGAQ